MGGSLKQGGSKTKPAKSKHLQSLQSDVATFAASLGLAVNGAVSSGFDDSDFRKTGTIGKQKETKVKTVKGKDSKEDRGKSSKEKKETVARKSLPEITANSARKDHREFSAGDGLKSKGSGQVAKKYIQVPNNSNPENFRNNGMHSRKRKYPQDKNPDREQEPKRLFLVNTPSEGEHVRKLRMEGQGLLDQEANNFVKSRSKDKDTEWLLKARRSGTSSDKVAAMTVLLQENARANVATFDALLGMITSKAGKRHAVVGIDALKELFLHNLLPDHKLKYLAQQPLSSLASEGKERNSQLLDWIWEDVLKTRYERFVVGLDEASKDKLPFLKDKALKATYELLKAKPEQERRLLSVLVNKLGDPERKVASNASYLLSCLLTAHPNMKKVVIDEVDAFVFRPRVGLRARYYAAVFLNQIVLSNKGNGPVVAKQLIDLYFALFKAVTTSEEDHEIDLEKAKVKKPFSKGKRKENVKTKLYADDFTTEIDSRLLSALLVGVNRSLPYISAEDLDTVTQENAVLFRLVHSRNFNVAVQALMLLHQIMVKNQAVSDRFYRALYAVLLSDGLMKSSKAEMFLGLVFKSLKSDVDQRRIAAFAKRLAQVAMQQSPEFACASLFLISESLKLKPIIWNAILNVEEQDDDVEHFKDEIDDADRNGDDTTKDIDSDIAHDGETWPKRGCYDSKSRDPLYCQAYRACWWELTVLAEHFHPSVAAMARTLLSGANIVYHGDPLRDFTLGVFLDRFVEKKPKASAQKAEGTWHGSALAPPSKMGVAKPLGPIGEEILKIAEEDVAPQDLIFHKFYSRKSLRTKPKKKKKSETEEDFLGLDEGGVTEWAENSDDDEVDDFLEAEAAEDLMEGDFSEGESFDSGDEGMVYADKDRDIDLGEDGGDQDLENGDDDEDSAGLSDEDSEDGLVELGDGDEDGELSSDGGAEELDLITDEFVGTKATSYHKQKGKSPFVDREEWLRRSSKPRNAK